MKPNPTHLSRRQPTGRQNRRGTAIVEFAVCLPVIIIIVFGAIEAASMLFLRQALIQSSYEAAKVAVKAGGTNAKAILVAEQVAVGRRINQLTVTFDPPDVTSAAQGELVRVTVSAPGDANSLLRFGAFRGKTIVARAVMVKEVVAAAPGQLTPGPVPPPSNPNSPPRPVAPPGNPNPPPVIAKD